MLTKLGELLKQASYSIYELLYVLWNKVNDVIDSHNTTDQKLTDEINTRITEDNKKVNNTDFNTLNKLDFKGTWQGLRPSQADPGISSVVDRHTTQLNDIGIDIENFPRLIPEVDDTGRFQRLFNSLPVNGGRIILKQGANYTISGQTLIENKKNIIVEGNNAIIQKTARNFMAFRFNYCENVSFMNTILKGMDTNVNQNWGDDGIVFYSCKRVNIEKCSLFDIGDSALRCSTSNSIDGIESMVYNVTHCYFENIQQTSTSFGGTIDINWKFNSTKDLHGSHKFFSRQSGSKIKILYNRIDTINGAIGIEFGQQNEVIISGNIIDGAGIGIRGYNNGDANNPVMIYNNPYDITITENILLNCKTHGIYIDSLGATDNTYNTLNNLKINGNIIRNLNPLNIAQTDINVDFSAIYLKSKTITNLEIKFNTLDSINGTAVQLYGTVYNMIDIESNVMSNLLRTILALYVYNESGAVCKNISIKNNHGTMGKELIKYNAFGGATQIDSFIIEGNNLTLENLNSLTFNNSRIANNNFVCSKSDTAFSWVYWNLVNSYLENNIFNAPNVQYALHGVFTSAKLFHNVFIGTLSTALSNAIKINDSTAVDVATLKTDFNNLLAKLRTLNLIG